MALLEEFVPNRVELQCGEIDPETWKVLERSSRHKWLGCRLVALNHNTFDGFTDVSCK